METTEYELFYWDALPGRGEFVRLVFEEAGEPYRDVARESGNGIILKYMKGEMEGVRPFAPPFIKHKEHIIAQVSNILMYIGRQFGLAGEDEFAVNQYQLTIADFVEEVHKTHHPVSTALYYEQQREACLEAAKSFREVRMLKFLSYFESILKKNGPFVEGSKLTVVDLSLFHIIRGLKYSFPRALTRLTPEIPALVALHDAVAKRPNISAYLSSPRCMPFNENGIFRKSLVLLCAKKAKNGNSEPILSPMNHPTSKSTIFITGQHALPPSNDPSRHVATEHMLFELTDEVLNAVEMGKDVIFKGSRDSDAVLCTDSDTYSVRTLETSNTILLAVEEGENLVVHDSLGCIFELSKIGPRLHHLRELLHKRVYSGDVEEAVIIEEQGTKDLVSWELLNEVIQGSEEEIKVGLSELNAFEMNGYWRVISEKYARDIMDQVLMAAMQYDWDLKSLTMSQILDEVTPVGYERRSVGLVLWDYCNKADIHRVDTKEVVISPSSDVLIGDFDVIVALDPARVSLLRAKQLLSLGERWKHEEFMDAWRDALPEGISMDLSVLRGHAIEEVLGPSTYIKALDFAELPIDLTQRFKILFAARGQWTLDDISAYLTDVACNGDPLDRIILHYARAVTSPDGSIIYCARETALL